MKQEFFFGAILFVFLAAPMAARFDGLDNPQNLEDAIGLCGRVYVVYGDFTGSDFDGVHSFPACIGGVRGEATLRIEDGRLVLESKTPTMVVIQVDEGVESLSDIFSVAYSFAHATEILLNIEEATIFTVPTQNVICFTAKRGFWVRTLSFGILRWKNIYARSGFLDYLKKSIDR